MKKKIAIFSIWFILFFFVFSLFYIATEIDHECIGENCNICEQVTFCENTFEKYLLDIVTIFGCLSMFFGIVLTLMYKKQTLIFDSLISLKVKLSN